MEEAIQAFQKSIEYAVSQIAWYEPRANRQFYLFRGFGVLAIIASIAVTFLAAKMNETYTHIFGMKISAVVAVLALVSTASVSLSSFFGWKTSWESYRTAQLKLEYVIQSAQVKQLRLQRDNDADGLFTLAAKVADAVSQIVEAETSTFYQGLGDIDSIIKKGDRN